MGTQVGARWEGEDQMMYSGRVREEGIGYGRRAGYMGRASQSGGRDAPRQAGDNLSGRDSSDSVSSANGVMAASCCARGTASHLTT